MDDQFSLKLTLDKLKAQISQMAEAQSSMAEDTNRAHNLTYSRESELRDS